jgi:hypothetical protein
MKKPRDLAMAAAALAAVVAALAIGFHQLGPRANQRAIRADERRIADLRSIAQAIYFRNQQKKPLPATLSYLPLSAGTSGKDPLTSAPYEYHPASGTAYELCATFATDSTADEDGFQPRSAFWNHTKGRHCYQLDASLVVEY